MKFVGSFVLLATGGGFALAIFYPGIADQVWSIIGHCISAATGALGCLLAVRTRK